MRILLPVLLFGLSIPALAQSVALPAGTSQFAITQEGKQVGTTESTINALPSGYAIESHGEMHLGKFSYSFTSQNRLDPSLNLVRDAITGTVNGKQASFDAQSSPDGRNIDIQTHGDGKNETNSVLRHRNLVVLPDFDAAAYVEMVHFAMLRPETSWVLIPKENGILVPCDYEPQYPVQATRDGAPVSVQHTTVVVSAQNAVSIELYYTQDGTLMEADLPQQNFYVIRNGFHLINRPKSKVPRVSGPPQGGDQGQPQAPGQGEPGQQPYPPQQPQQYQIPQGPPPTMQPQ